MRDKKTWHINNFYSWTHTIFSVYWELTVSADILYLYCLFALLTRPYAYNKRMQHDGKMVKIKVKIARLSASCQLSHSPLFFTMCAACMDLDRVAEAEVTTAGFYTIHKCGRHGPMKPIASFTSVLETIVFRWCNVLFNNSKCLRQNFISWMQNII